MKKRILSLLLALCLICSLLPGVALATNETLTYKVPGTNIVLTYIVNKDDSISITACYKPASGTLEIPDTIDGKPVTSILYEAFARCELTCVVIPDSITSIGGFAFHLCGSLTNITLSNSVTSIATGTFWSCDSLTSVTIPDSVTSIGNQAFYGCSSLASITIPDSVTSIGSATFYGCDSLTINGVCGSVAETYAMENRFTFNKTHNVTIIPAVAPTCTELGLTAGSKCAGCGEILTIPETIPATGHDWGEWGTTIPSTCVSDGIKKRICANCGAVETQEIGVANHEWNNDFTIDEEATCTTSGTKSIHCKNCDAVKDSQSIPATGHSEVIDPEVPATCITAGKTEGKHCSVCNEIIIAQKATPALGHEAGEKYFADSSKHWKTCIRCGEPCEQEKHQYIVDSCDVEMGCPTCGYEKPAGEHIWDDGKTVLAPTCGTTGIKEYSCTACSKTKTEIIPATGIHTEVIDPAVTPTCTTAGKTEGKHCSVCNAVITAQTEIPALGHDFTGTYLTDETGHWHKCSRCDAVDTKAAHTYNTTNCGEAANCTVCGYTKAAGTHTWNAGEVITAPTCTTTGTVKHTCTSCGATKTETLPASHNSAQAWSSDGAGHWHNCTVCNQKVDSASHTFGSWTTTKAATATEAGSRERACTVCRYKQTETIPATGGGSSGGGSIGGGGGGLVIAPPAEEKKDEEQTTNAAVYNDISANAWYNDAVSFVTEKGLMSGTGTNTFAPGANLTRAMLAQILYNNENKPATSGNAFTDVQSGAWYTDAITWATQKGIVSGYGNGQFGPDDSITREQLAVMLWRYAGQPTSNASLNGFTDIDKASDYALTALQWAVEKGIISGKGNGTLDPTGNATRAEVAQMLMNYFK